MNHRLKVLLAFGLSALLLVACGQRDVPSNELLEDSFSQGRTSVWLGGHGTVVREISGDADTQRFQLRINEALNLILVHRVGSGGRIPAERGDVLSFHGRYEFNAAGGEVRLTHADPVQPGGGGWVSHRGVRYD